MRSLDIVNLVSGIVVVGFCVFLIGLAVVIATRPSLAERLLMSFASSASAHYTEQGLRLLVGAALVTFSSSMWYPELFKLFGWLIVVTTVALLLMPWRWHRNFATRVMPLIIRYIGVFAVGASALGAFILYAASRAVVS